MRKVAFIPLTLAVAAALGAQSTSCQAADALNTKLLNFALDGGIYAISPIVKKGDATRRINTFLPSGSLLRVNNDHVTQINNLPFVEAETLYGIKILVPRSEISRGDFFSIYHNQNVIIHEDIENVEGCTDTPCDPDASIPKGSVLELDNNLEVAVLRGHKDGQALNYHIPKSKLNQYAKTGVLTRLDAPPEIYHSESQIISQGQCGVISTHENSNHNTVGVSGKLGVELNGSSVDVHGSSQHEDETKTSRSFGATDASYEKRRITMTRLDPQSFKPTQDHQVYIVISKLVCEGQAPGEAMPMYYSNVTVSRLGSEDQPIGRVNFESFYAPLKNDEKINGIKYTLGQNNNRPFITSINHKRHYRNALMTWLKAVNNLPLAQVLLSEFNATCRIHDPLNELDGRGQCAKQLPLQE